MNDLIQEAMWAAETLDAERMPATASLLRRLATALHSQGIELESRTALHVECLGTVKELGDQLLECSRQLAGVQVRRPRRRSA